MKPKWLDKQLSHREKSDKRVKKIAKQTGGRVVSNSGATPFAKGDVSYPEQLVEHKLTNKESYKLNKSDLAKIYRDAIKSGKTPFFMIDFGNIRLLGEVRKGEK